MLNLKRYKTFESYTLQNLEFDQNVIDKLLSVSKKKIIEDYWIEQGEVLNPAKTDPNFPNDAYLDQKPVSWEGPILKIQLQDSHVYVFDQFDEKNLIKFLDTIENNSVYIPREEVESIKEVMLLINEGWDLFHIAENRADFILKLAMNGKNVWIVGLTFRKIEDKIKVTLKSNIVRSKVGQYVLEKNVEDKSTAILTAKNFMKQFYSDFWLKNKL